MAAKAQQIYNDFVAVKATKQVRFQNWLLIIFFSSIIKYKFNFNFSPLYYFAYQVNLDAETRLITLTNIQSNIPDPYAFDRAQRRSQYMMERDSYLRFLQSGLFLELAYPERYQCLRFLPARSHCVVSIVSLCQFMFSNNI